MQEENRGNDKLGQTPKKFVQFVAKINDFE